MTTNAPGRPAPATERSAPLHDGTPSPSPAACALLLGACGSAAQDQDTGIPPQDGSDERAGGDPIRGFRSFVNHPATVFLQDLPAWWQLPDATIAFQPGETAPTILYVPCWTGYTVTRPDLVQRLDVCVLRRDLVGVATARR